MTGFNAHDVPKADIPQLSLTRRALDGAAYGALLLLALLAAFEWPAGLLQITPRITVTNIEVQLALTVGLWLLRSAVDRRALLAPLALVAPLVVWIAVMGLAMLLATSHRLDALRFVSRVVSGAALAWIAYNVGAQPRREAILQAFVVGGTVMALLGLAEVGGVASIAAGLVHMRGAPTRVGELIRLTSTMIYATITAMYLEMVIPIAIAWAVTARQRALRGLLASSVVALLAALVLTLTRAGIVAVSLALLAAGIVCWRPLRRLALANLSAVAAMIAISIALVVANPLVGLRLASENDVSWYQATYQAPAELTLRSHETASLPLTVTNTGLRTWQASGATSFALSYHIRNTDGTAVVANGLRTRLPANVAPGASLTLAVQITAPAAPGVYTVEWDMVQETITWFTAKGGQPLRMRLSVGEEAAAESATDPAVTKTPVLPMSAPPTGRLDLWRVAWQMLRERPILGIGPDNFRYFYGAYLGQARWNTTIHANNTYVEFFVGAGLVGGTAFLWLAGSFWALLLRAVRRIGTTLVPAGGAQDSADVWLMALVASLLAWFLHGFLDHFYGFTPTYVVFWLMAGLAVRMAGDAGKQTH
jgi:hypothetical protein